ncbi:MAG: YceI family protein [Rhodanobacter sp.]
MKRLAILLLALTLPSIGAAADYSVQPDASKLGFNAIFQGESFDGQFGQWSAVIRYDAADLASSKFDVEVTLASVKTGDSDRDTTLPGVDFFNVAKFPTAHFVTTGFHQSNGKVIADGNLSLRGVTRPLSLAITFKTQGDGATLDVVSTVKRLDFGVGAGDYADTSVIGPDVNITAHLQLLAK